MRGSDLTKIHKVSNSDLQRPRLMFSSLRQILFKTRTIALHQRSYTLIVKFQARMGVGTRHDQPDPDCWACVRAEGSSQGSLLEQKHQWVSWVSCMDDLFAEAGWRCWKWLETAPVFHGPCQGQYIRPQQLKEEVKSSLTQEHL